MLKKFERGVRCDVYVSDRADVLFEDSVTEVYFMAVNYNFFSIKEFKIEINFDKRWKKQELVLTVLTLLY
jgi:hypothetical protein